MNVLFPKKIEIILLCKICVQLKFLYSSLFIHSFSSTIPFCLYLKASDSNLIHFLEK